ncbi:MAG TPA: ATP-binding protein [Microbacterium sp.]|nr:ATP-binding protein [Microbacterium sp.]
MERVAETSSGGSPEQTRGPLSIRPGDQDPWIGSSLAGAMRRAQLAGIVLVQLVLLLAALASPLSVPDAAAVAVAAVVVLAGLAVLLLRAHALVLIVPYYLALGFYYVVAVDPNDPLLGALIPLTAWTIILPIMLRTGAWPVVASGLLTAACTALILIAHPDWDRSVVSASLAANAIFVIAAALFMHALRRIARTLDWQKDAAAEEELRTARQQASAQATAEYVRVLHDTIVNTFGALARDGSRETDPVEAQERCRRDLERIRSFNRRSVGDRDHRLSLTDLDNVGLPVIWAGISGDDLRRFQALLPVPVLDALYGCASEAILNAAKHSGAERVTVDIRYADDVLHVEISDDGRGFDRSSTTERGIADSLFARGDAHGILVSLDSAIGEGTTVRLSSPLNAPEDSATAADPQEAARPLRMFIQGMALAWGLHAILAGIALEAANPGYDIVPAFVLLAMLLVFTGVVWAVRRQGGPASGWLRASMFVAIPVANWCALASVDYGRDAPYLFQAMSLTVLPVLIHVCSSTLTPFVAAVGLQVTSTLVIAAIADSGVHRFAAIALLEAPTFALLAVWCIFLLMFRSIGAEVADAQRKMERALRDAAVYEAAAEIQLQWSASALQAPLGLLQGIADGTISPNDPETRRRCADEETFLRQISALPLSATSMSRWFALALAEARRKQIRLELRAEQAHVADVESAEAFGRLMLDCIAGSSERRTLIVTLLQRGDSTRMLIVGSCISDLATHAPRRDRDRLRIAIETLPDGLLIDASIRPSEDPPGRQGRRSSRMHR